MFQKQVTGSISKTVFTDVVLLILSVVMGLQTTMSFEDREDHLPPVRLPRADTSLDKKGRSDINSPRITLMQGDNTIRYFYDERQVNREELLDLLEKNRIQHLNVRVDQESLPEIASFIAFYAKLRQSGVQKIAYNVTPRSQ